MRGSDIFGTSDWGDTGVSCPGADGQQMQGMLERMQGMLEHMQDTLEHMPSGQGCGGMMSTSGMSAEEDEDDEEASMMGYGGMMGMRDMMRHGHAMLRLLDRLAAQLDLSDDQQVQIRMLVRQHMKKVVQARAGIADKRIDLLTLLDADAPDLSKVKATLQAIASQQADLMFDSISLVQKVNKLLTPEQQKQCRAMRRQMMYGHGGMMGHRGLYGEGGMIQRGAMMGRESEKIDSCCVERVSCHAS
jgi:Spy/CpxP family protein refolding chaperone